MINWPKPGGKIGHAWGVSSVWSYGRALDSALDLLQKIRGGGHLSTS